MRATLEDGRPIAGDEILVAVGGHRTRAIWDWARWDSGRGRPVTVDDQLRAGGVEGGWLYGVGDVTARPR